MSTPDIPGYRILRKLGRGGMATVYAAVQEGLEREVAIKVMDPELLRDESFSKRFRRESRIVAKLEHPHIIRVHDVGLVDKHHYLVMELVTGGDLIGRLQDGLDVPAAFRVIQEVAQGLDFAHSENFVHRDIKPENVLFRENGSSVLSDFGIAREMEGDAQITSVGFVLGTPFYMSPEQVAGEKLDGRSDLYSLGVVFYQTLTGKVPYEGDSPVNIGMRHIKDPLPRLPQQLASMQPLIDRFMAKKPVHRFQSGAEVAAALERFQKANKLPSTIVRVAPVPTASTVGSKQLTTKRTAEKEELAATRVMQVKTSHGFQLRYVAMGVGLALAISAGLWFLLS